MIGEKMISGAGREVCRIAEKDNEEDEGGLRGQVTE
jgi:hypothetical protein